MSNIVTRITNFERSQWWVLLIDGILTILFGIAAILLPGLTLLVLVYLFGAYALVDGIFTIVAAFQQRKVNSEWWWTLIEGIAGVIVGLLVFFWPGVTSLVMFYLIAAWAFVTGIFALAAGLLSRSWLAVLGGFLWVVLGIIFFAHPVAGILSILWLLGVFAIVIGVVQVVHAFQVRSA